MQSSMIFLETLGFAEQFGRILRTLVQDAQKRKRFQDAAISLVREIFSTETEARFVADKVLGRAEVVQLLLFATTRSSRKQELLDIFEAEVEQAGLAQWEAFAPKVSKFIDKTVDLQLEVFGAADVIALAAIVKRTLEDLKVSTQVRHAPSNTELPHMVGQSNSLSELAPTQLNKFVDLLLACPSIEDPHIRDLMIKQLPQKVWPSISRYSQARADVLSIVTTLNKYTDGISIWIEILRAQDGTTIPFIAVQTYLQVYSAEQG